MTIILFLFAVLVIFHFVYEGILAPSLRLRMRFELFKLRDELRTLRASNPDEFTGDAFRLNQDILHNAINLLSRVTPGAVIKAVGTIEHENSLIEETTERIAQLAACSSPEVKRIHAETLYVLLKALLISCGGWFIYVIPILFIAVSMERIKGFIERIATLPPPQIDRIVPPRVSVIS